ncbi:MAG: tripartite tricarboxylate transporter substrate binding protein [Burkholderiales bacterium]
MIGRVAALLAGLALALPAANAQAPRFPERPVRIVVPFPAPGAADYLGRLIAQRLAAATGQQVLVENRPGAAAAIGADHVAKSAPDGYTLLLGTTSSHAIGPAVGKLPYDPVKDFAPITMVSYSAFALVVHPSVPANNVAELVALARSRPGKLDMASFGNGSAAHLFGELFKARAGVFMLHVPYKGSAPALLDLIAGRTHLMFDNLLSVLPHVKAGKLRALGVTTNTRAAAAPELPPIADTLPGYEAIGWFGMFAPARTPAPIVHELNAAVVRILKDAEMRNLLAARGMTAVGDRADEFAATIGRDLAKWTQLVKSAGIRIE